MRKSVIILIFVFTIMGAFASYHEYQLEKIAEKMVHEQEKMTNLIIQAHFKEQIKNKEHLILKRTMKITGYAPLDPKAVKGMCYAGDPAITASGRKTKPGITIAASKKIPFGTLIYIPTLGWRTVEDRGGKIKGNRIDVCFTTREEAIAWGVQNHEVYILFPMEDE